jgi:thiol-disulfide isomerase/thioredoxin
MIHNAIKVIPNQLLQQGGKFYLPTATFNQSAANFFVIVADWCGHCKRLAQTLNELQEHYPIDVYYMSDKDPYTPMVMDKMGVRGFPSVFKIRSGGELVPYNGPRDAAGLLSSAYR